MSTDKHPLDQQLLRASAKGRLHDVINLLQKGATLAVNKVVLWFFGHYT